MTTSPVPTSGRGLVPDDPGQRARGDVAPASTRPVRSGGCDRIKCDLAGWAPMRPTPVWSRSIGRVSSVYATVWGALSVLADCSMARRRQRGRRACSVAGRGRGPRARLPRRRSMATSCGCVRPPERLLVVPARDDPPGERGPLDAHPRRRLCRSERAAIGMTTRRPRSCRRARAARHGRAPCPRRCQWHGAVADTTKLVAMVCGQEVSKV